MEPTEYKASLQLALDDVTAIIQNQQVIAGIHAELNKNSSMPFEQDYIYEEHFGQKPSQPKEFIYNGVKILTRILHQTGIGLSDIHGVDLLYEIESEKFSLIQYKRASKNSIKNDPEQLSSLLSNCPDICLNKRKRPIPIEWLPTKTFTFCGCWYAVIDDGYKIYVPACEAESIFEGRKSTVLSSFSKGLSRRIFLDLFSSCRLGALLRYPKDVSLKDAYTENILAQKHAVLEVSQQGKWDNE